MSDTTQREWDLYFLDIAYRVARKSKDPSTKTAAIIVDPDHRIISTGYNGLPFTMPDDSEQLSNREWKYEHIIHCENNAILFARRDLRGTTLYTVPFVSCVRCMSYVAQSGIARHVAPTSSHPRFGEEVQLASIRKAFVCGVEVILIPEAEVLEYIAAFTPKDLYATP